MENTPVPLLVERAVAGGEMLARGEGGSVVFLRGVIPGERVRARIVRRAKGVAWAELVAIEEPSPDRREWPGEPTCGGTHFAHIDPARQLTLKAEIIADAFRRIAKHPLEAPPHVAASPEQGYRLRARLHLRNLDVGFFRERTHTLCDASSSRQLREESIRAARAVVAALGPRADDCDALVIAENIAADARVIHLERGGHLESSGHPEPRAGAFLRDLDPAALMVDGVSGVTTSVAGQGVTLAGTPTVTDTAADLFGDEPPVDAQTAWTRHATSFFQGNRFLAGALVRHVLAATTDIGARDVVDLYAGVGLFAVAMAARGARVTAVEGDPSSAADLTANAAPFGDKLRAVFSSVEHVLASSAPANQTVVVDPPRPGLTPEAVQGIIAWRPARIVYVSCDPPTLARDARALIGAGYRIGAVDAFDLFPNTPHVETVAIFDR